MFLIGKSLRKLIEQLSSRLCSILTRVFEKSSAGEDTFENIFDEKEFDNVQDAFKDFDLIFL